MVFPHKKTLSCRPSQGGFTLVEILVVIAIIALLAGVALPAVTGAIKKAKENAAVQTGHGLGLAEFQYATDNNGTFPGTTANLAVTTSSIAFQNQLYPSYMNSTDGLYIAGGACTGKWNGTGTIDATSNAWDMVFRDGAGTPLNSNDPDQLPALLTTGYTITTYGATAGGTPASATLANAAKAPFGSDGIAVVYKYLSSAFITQVSNGGKSGAGVYTLTSGSIEPAAGITYAALQP